MYGAWCRLEDSGFRRNSTTGVLSFSRRSFAIVCMCLMRISSADDLRGICLCGGWRCALIVHSQFRIDGTKITQVHKGERPRGPIQGCTMKLRETTRGERRRREHACGTNTHPHPHPHPHPPAHPPTHPPTHTGASLLRGRGGGTETTSWAFSQPNSTAILLVVPNLRNTCAITPSSPPCC